MNYQWVRLVNIFSLMEGKFFSHTSSLLIFSSGQLLHLRTSWQLETQSFGIMWTRIIHLRARKKRLKWRPTFREFRETSWKMKTKGQENCLTTCIFSITGKFETFKKACYIAIQNSSFSIEVERETFQKRILFVSHEIYCSWAQSDILEEILWKFDSYWSPHKWDNVDFDVTLSEMMPMSFY